MVRQATLGRANRMKAGVLPYTKRITMLCALAVALAGVSPAFAGPVTNYWVGGSGNWSERSNWFKDAAGTIPATRYPGEDPNETQDVAYFEEKSTGTINIDVDSTIYAFFVKNQKSASYANLEFTGSGTLTCNSGSNTAGYRPQINGHSVVFRDVKIVFAKHFAVDRGTTTFASGADITLGGQLYAWHNNATVKFLDGCKIKASYLSAQLAGASHVIEGGTINASLNVEVANSTIRIAGGTITAPTMPTIHANGTFIFTNGTLTVTAAATTTDRRLLGQGNAVFRSTVSPADSTTGSSGYLKRPSINVFTEDGDTATFSGTIFATNGNYSALHFTNSVTVNANVLNLSRITIADVKDVTLNAKRVNLGKRIYPTLNNPTLTIPYGTTFGAFGDWYVYVNNNRKFTMYLNGDIVVDTTDCFDGVTPHTIGFWKLVTKPAMTLTVCGNGTCDLAFSTVPDILRRVDVMEGAALQITNNTTATMVDDFSLGANSTLRLRAGKSPLDAAKFTFDPTAAIEMVVPSGLSYAAYMVAGAQDDDSAAALAARTTLTGTGASGWSIRSGANTVYLSNGVEPTYGETGSSNIWTGAVSGYWNDAQNWVSGVVPYSSTKVDSGVANAAYIAGTRNTDITNTISGTTYLTRLAFLDSCGPVRISGGKFSFGYNGYRNRNSSPIFSFSRFPAIIESDVQTGNALSTVAAQDSYVALNGTTTIAKMFRPTGEVRVGGNLTCREILLETTMDSGRSTKMHVLSGGKVTATAQVTNQVVAASCYVVDAGGELVFENGDGAEHGLRVTMNVSQVNGLIDFRCPYSSMRDQYFYGTGTVQVASVKSRAERSAVITLGCGITLKPKSWTTVTANAPDSYIKIAVTNSAILSAAANWTYGPAADVTPTTTAAARALEIADRATLAVRTDGYTVSFADPIVGEGSLVIAEGSKVALAGDLYASAKNDWTTFATVGSFSAAPGTFPENYRVHTVENGDGTVSVQAKLILGLMFTIR